MHLGRVCASATVVIACIMFPVVASADPGGNGNGNGNAFGWGFGGVGGGGRGGPIPLLGLTLLGQLGAVAGGGYLVWRRRRAGRAT